jgi:hypothetical protein
MTSRKVRVAIIVDGDEEFLITAGEHLANELSADWLSSNPVLQEDVLGLLGGLSLALQGHTALDLAQSVNGGQRYTVAATTTVKL